MPVRSPTITAVAVDGRTWASKKARTALSSIRRTVSSVPRRGRDIRAVAGNSSLESCLAARRDGLACSCGISSRRLPTRRSISLPSKAGARSASATRPRAFVSREAGTSRETRTPGWSACASSVAPQRSSSAANSSALCLSVPSDSARDMIVATPSRPSGSASSGASRKISTATTCWPGRWQRSTVSPLGRAPRSGAGKAQGRAVPGVGCGWYSMATPVTAASLTCPPPRARRCLLRPRWPRRVGSMGSYTSTARLSGRRAASAAARTSSAVTSRTRPTALRASCGSPNRTA